MRLISCQVWCSVDHEAERKAEKLGIEIDSGDCWMPITIDLDRVWTVKMSGDNDFIGEKKATVFVGDTHFVVDIGYYEFVECWIGISNYAGLTKHD